MPVGESVNDRGDQLSDDGPSLFADLPEQPAPPRPRVPRVRLPVAAVVEGDWQVESHVCMACFGRVLSRKVDVGQLRVWRCSNCGAEAEAPKVSALCACGARIGTKNAGLRCVPNPDRRPEVPAEIIVKETE